MDRRREQPPAIVVAIALLIVVILGPVAVINSVKEYDQDHKVMCPRISSTMDHIAYYCLAYVSMVFVLVAIIMVHVCMD